MTEEVEKIHEPAFSKEPVMKLVTVIQTDLGHAYVVVLSDSVYHKEILESAAETVDVALMGYYEGI